MKKLIVTVFCVITIFAVFITSVGALDANNGQTISINADANGYFDTVRIWSRMAKMQAYSYPSYIYYNDEVTSELSTHLTYSPVNLPMFFNSATSLTEGTYANINTINTAVGYTGSNMIQYQYTYSGYPYLYRDMDGNTTFQYHIQSTPNSVFSNSKERHMMHGTTYGYYDSNGNSYGLGIVNSHGTTEAHNVICFITGELEVYADTGLTVNGQPQYLYERKDIEAVRTIAPQEHININWELLTDFDPSDNSTVMSKFTGTIVCAYTEGAFRYCTFTESIPDKYSQVVTFNDTLGLYNDEGEEFDGIVGDWVTPETEWDVFVKAYSNREGGVVIPPTGSILIDANGTYNVSGYASAVVNVPQEIAWSGLFDWIFDSIGAFMHFEIAPEWSIGTIMSIVVSLAVGIWLIRIFMGG